VKFLPLSCESFLSDKGAKINYFALQNKVKCKEKEAGKRGAKKYFFFTIDE
jgi:hypothetical protein